MRGNPLTRLQIDNILAPVRLTLVPKKDCPKHESPSYTGRTWRSRDFLVQEHREPCGHIRLSINRTRLNAEGTMWDDNISWDELMEIKRQCGFANKCAVEVMPPDKMIINVANMRHLFILPEVPGYVWQKNDSTTKTGERK